ncbi:MAG: hypothetical protein SCK28_00195 [Bacillota bacterium]|nr:hypothetical protein [Bacillota bacterium]
MRNKVIIVTIVLLAVAGIMLKPVFFPRVFAVTPEPYQAYQTALASGKPIFIEFYASW